MIRHDLTSRLGQALRDLELIFRDVAHFNKHALDTLDHYPADVGQQLAITEGLRYFLKLEHDRLRANDLKNKPSECPVQFFWLQEESEIWAAHSLDQFAWYVRAHVLDPHDWPRFTAEDEGENWGRVGAFSAEVRILQEDGTKLTPIESAHACEFLPSQICTQYN